MAGIYIHIPFCKKACHYCNFHFSTSTQLKDEFINALVQEVELQKDYLTEPIQTIYIGGGTPSILSISDVETIINALQYSFTLASGIEMTLEANPDDITIEKIIAWKNLGINRLSIGIQSFVAADLQWMNRAHDVAQAKQCIEDAIKNGITNLSIDLIYGTPNLSNEDWIMNIKTAAAMGIQHLSCYALTVEPNTALEKMILQKKKAPVDANKAATQFEILMNLAPKLGFEHYEISNFAKKGFRSLHNSSYWQGKSYLGLGPSAHSFNGSTRQWNVANNALYIQSLKNNIVPFEIETLTIKEQCNEYIMTSLRTIEGLDIGLIEKLYKVKMAAKVEKYLSAKLMILENNFLTLTNAGKLRADGIAADLFM
jgi:oxygen-independent coproporphyrinogen III oxidase